jgi:UDP-N-acetyl-D-glucosamine dehydrogenase
MKKLVVIGQGYVGLPMALRAAEVGLEVTGLDSDGALVERINAGRSHITDVSDQALRSGLDFGYSATSDPACLAEANAILVCVPTPLHRDGGPDLSAIVAAGTTIGRHVRPGALVVLESTTYPGTTEEVFAPLVLGENRRIGDVHIAFSPERIDPGNRTFDVRNTPKVVGGLTPECTEVARHFYGQFIDTVVAAASAKEAEMAKLLENTFRHVNIALVNEMLRFSNDLGIDLWNAIDCAATKPFGYMAFRPGPGVGGHCIPVDPSYLSHRVKAELGYAFRMVELAEEINKAAPLYVATRTWEALNRRRLAVRGARVLLIGVTYKPDIADCRESPAVPLAKRLTEWGADVCYHDPLVPEWRPALGGVPYAASTGDVYAAARDADVTVLLQPHHSYDLAALSRGARLIIDTRGALLAGPNVERL